MGKKVKPSKTPLKENVAEVDDCKDRIMDPEFERISPIEIYAGTIQ